MKKFLLAALTCIVIFSACKKEEVGSPNNSSFNKSLLLNHWWYTDYNRTNWMAEYKGRYFKPDSTFLVDQTNFGLGVGEGGRWYWGKKDTIVMDGMGSIKGVVKNLTTDSLAIYWLWETVGGSGSPGFTAYYHK